MEKDEPMAPTTQHRKIHRFRHTAEEPLEIRIGGSSYAVTMRIPGHDFDLVAGFLVSEESFADTPN
jgi:FdhD protein